MVSRLRLPFFPAIPAFECTTRSGHVDLFAYDMPDRLFHDKVVDETKVQVLELLKKTIRPEFLNRIDDIIMFTPLNEEEIRKIVIVQLNSVKKMLAQNGIALEFTDAALTFISDKGFDPQFGARPVKRVIQKYVLNELSKELLGGKINKDRPITIDSNGAGLVFKN